MTLTLTILEVETMLREKYNLPASVQIVIGNLKEDLAETIKNRLAKFPDQFTDKIARIKELRTLYSELYPTTMGLADAKYAIEHFDSFLEFVHRAQRFPKANYRTNGWLNCLIY